MMNYILRRKGVGEKLSPMEGYSTTGLRVIYSNEALPQNPDFVFRWGCTATIPHAEHTLNKASAIHLVYDKRGFRLVLSEHGLAPKSFGSFDAFMDGHNPDKRYIVRPKQHIRSQDLEVCADIREVYYASKKFAGGYISEYIPKDSEYRVFVIQGRIVAVVKKIPTDPTAVSWGCVDQGEFEYIPWSEWPLSVTQKALQAFSHSGLDFGAIDMISLAGEALCLEINTAPELTPYYQKAFTKCFDYIVENGPDHPPVTGTTWKHMIHPAISKEAA